MPIKDYGVLKGKATQRILATKSSEHYQILVNHGNHPHRIAINTQSTDAPSQVLFYANDDFHHALTDALVQAGLPDGYTPLPSQADGLALDFIRGNLFDVSKMVPLDGTLPGDNNDLNDKLDLFVQQAISDADAVIYAFGQHWVDASGADAYFPEINPSTGIHDIHMNQAIPGAASLGTMVLTRTVGCCSNSLRGTGGRRSLRLFSPSPFIRMMSRAIHLMTCRRMIPVSRRTIRRCGSWLRW